MHALIAAGWRAAIVAAGLGVLAPQSIPKSNDKVCSIEGATLMAFGTYDPVDDAPLDVQGRVSYRCGHENDFSAFTRRSVQDPRDALTVQISLSAGMSGGFDRYMRGGLDRLRYNLYLDGSHTQIWGDGTGGTGVYTSKAQPNNKVVVVPVFGRVFPVQDVSSAIYIDTLVVTLDF
jgi:spore coat protein U-like protein